MLTFSLSYVTRSLGFIYLFGFRLLITGFSSLFGRFNVLTMSYYFTHDMLSV